MGDSSKWISAARFTGSAFILPMIPALKCWATFGRPLRGLQTVTAS